MKKIAIYAVIGCAAFLASFLARARHSRNTLSSIPRPAADAPDSVQLAALGIRPGIQLVAYVFGGSRCGFCQKPETKQALALLRQVLTRGYVNSGVYKSVSVVGVAVNTDLREGLGYLESVGPDVFNEISVGSGWQNEHVIRLIGQNRIADAGVPLVIVVSRSMTATLAPLTMKYGVDSVVKVIQGSGPIIDWVRSGASLVTSTSTALESDGLTPEREVLKPPAGRLQSRRGK